MSDINEDGLKMGCFQCEKCGKYILDGMRGCEHYPLKKPVIKVCNPEKELDMPEPEDIRKMSDKQDSPIVEAMKESPKIELCYGDNKMWYGFIENEKVSIKNVWIVTSDERISFMGESISAAVKALKGAKR